MIRSFAYLFIFLFVGVAFVTCQRAGYRSVDRTENGVVIVLPEGKETRKIRLEVLSDKIIRVTATPDEEFPERESLMAVDREWDTPSWDFEERDNKVTVTTAILKAEVNCLTGEVSFRDAAGNVLLQEIGGGGKSFETVSIDNQSYYAIRQVFESPDDEAFYGLGQHQNGEVNYKGLDVELAQHNIVAVVPFLYSSKNYGILWDNYSITRFGDPREYQPISSLNLFDREGQPGGLTADYYVGEEVRYTKKSDDINFTYLETPALDSFPREVARDGRVVWEGSLSSAVGGRHKFKLYASGYFKVWIDGNLIMDKWRQNWNPWWNKFELAMMPGDKHAIKLEWDPDDGGYFALTHLDPQSPEDQGRLSLSSEVAEAIDYYFVYGENPDDVISGYRQITGKASLVPKTAMGFWQSRERYKTQEELLEVARTYRRDSVPFDNIVLDWNYWPEDAWGSHRFDQQRFPDPRGMVDAVHNDLHAQLMISVWPKFYPGTDNFDSLNRHGFLFTRNLDKKRKDWIAQGYENTFYDPFNPGAREMFWQQIDQRLNSIGIDAWWLDATEPDMHSNLSIDERKLNMSPTALGPGSFYFNAYSLMNSKAVYEGQRASNPDDRIFILTRSAYAGQQRFASVTWSGDIVSRWSDMKDQIAAGVNFSLSGIPFWTMDIGGFAVERRYYDPTPANLAEWRELNTRWFQFGAFCPIFRSHGQYPFREIHHIAPKGHPAYETMLYYDKLRYRLMPYLYTLAGKSAVDDYTIMRGLVMDFHDDLKARNINDQYMLGPSILVNPVTTYKSTSRDVYLPAGRGWYDFHSGSFHEGGQTIRAAAPLSTMPLYVPEGAIIPAGPPMQYVNERNTDPVTLYVYAGKDGRFEIYEDDGVSYEYEKGEYSRIPLEYDDASGTLVIGERMGSFEGMLDERSFRVVWVRQGDPTGFTLKTTEGVVVRYVGQRVEVKLN